MTPPPPPVMTQAVSFSGYRDPQRATRKKVSSLKHEKVGDDLCAERKWPFSNKSDGLCAVSLLDPFFPR